MTKAEFRKKIANIHCYNSDGDDSTLGLQLAEYDEKLIDKIIYIFTEAQIATLQSLIDEGPTDSIYLTENESVNPRTAPYYQSRFDEIAKANARWRSLITEAIKKIKETN